MGDSAKKLFARTDILDSAEKFLRLKVERRVNHTKSALLKLISALCENLQDQEVDER